MTEILRLISSYRTRRPARICLFLDALFARLARCAPAEAGATEERIWDVWMHHPHHAAARARLQQTLLAQPLHRPERYVRRKRERSTGLRG